MALGQGFFQGWPTAPDEETQRRIMAASYRCLVAVDSSSQQIVGFITAISDGILSACLPLLEVLPTYRQRGIGSQIVQRMLEELKNLYMFDLSGDPDLQPFYEKQKFMRTVGMCRRNYENQSGRAAR